MQIQRKILVCFTNAPAIAVAKIGDNQPSDAVEGLLWVDTSNDGFVLKVYDGTTWQVVQAEVYLTKIDGGSL
jgi:hypothetical protein